ncbi:MAG: hypothetical protein II747_01975, partial [Clostridia bacterium]|nr:hypothetical protein [Clostridia bacterium]
LIILLLKSNRFKYIRIGIIRTINGYDPLIFYIVETVIDGDHNSLKGFYRSLGSQYIYVLFLAVGGK